MNKLTERKLLPLAAEALQSPLVGIVKNGSYSEEMRSRISDFGARLMNGSILAVIADFSEKAGSSADKPAILRAVQYVLKEGYYPDEASLAIKQKSDNKPDEKENQDVLFNFVKVRVATISAEMEMKEKLQNCADAVKLAMNLFHKGDSTTKQNKKDSTGQGDTNES